MESGPISTISVTGLFSQFDYQLSTRHEHSNLTILYGDNGVGKSTILSLVFHLLSPADDRGHRTALYNIPFESIAVTLSNGFLFSAYRPDGPGGEIIVLQVHHLSRLYAEWVYSKNERTRYDYDEFALRYSELNEDIRAIRPLRTAAQHRDLADGVRRGEEEYLRALGEYAPTIFFVSADRRLESDAVSDPAAEAEIRQLIAHRSSRAITDIARTWRQIGLNQALANASQWVTQKAVRSANQGSMNVHSVYESVLSQLSADYSADDSVGSKHKIDQTLRDLDYIETRTDSFSKYELSTPLSTYQFKNSLRRATKEGREIALRLIDPYVKSVMGRLRAIDPTYHVLDNFVNTINSFFTRKSLCFSLSNGFTIINERNETLDVTQLSSGEQQLLLMFCYALTTRDNPSVFMIDEPEISLNIKWQRRLLNSLSTVTEESDTQFIFASHSIELISQHQNSVVKLES